MIRITHAVATLLMLGACATATAAGKGDPKSGATKSKPCASCHGVDGNETLDPQYPRLAGQYPDYLLRAMQEYRNGRRENAIMAGFVKDLTDQDLADLAAFYASQKGALEDLSHLK